MQKKLFFHWLGVIISCFVIACGEHRDSVRFVPQQEGQLTIALRYLDITLLPENVVPIPNEEIETTGIAKLILYSDGRLHLDLVLEDFNSMDFIRTVNIFRGRPATNGVSILDIRSGILLESLRSEGYVQYTADVYLDDAQLDLFLDQHISLYLNLPSSLYPSGILRGQIR